jgi:2-oxoglutarate dehydrogenase E1 component
VARPWRKPLVVMTPKSLLRHPKAVSSLAECAQGRFQRVLPDPLARPANEVKRILLCSGKICYELEQHREETKRADVAILRLEQLYPFPDEHLRAALEPLPEGTPVVWVQEEPENMGAWRYLHARFGREFFGRFPLSAICRPASASPATGSLSTHKREQAEIIHRAFGGE